MACLSSEANIQFVFADRDTLDISDAASVHQFLGSQHFDIVVNCAAYTAVDKAETEQSVCYAINEAGAKNLAEECAITNTILIHVSTDFVFDGTSPLLLNEDDVVNPLSVYGASKLAGERAIAAATDKFIVIRTSWLYSSFGANFVKTILRLCAEKPSLNIIADQIGTPTYAADLAQFILLLIKADNLDQKTGVYHFSNEGVASWYDFAISIRDIAGLTTPILPIETYQYPTPATRPKFSVMNKRKVKETFGVTVPYWRDSLAVCIKKIKE
jgi:dTDP-4-dehydrorhamnose reductase